MLSAKIVFVAICVGSAVSIDFCDKKWCTFGINYLGEHIACGHSGTFSPSCPADRQLFEVTAEDIEVALDIHNFFRNKTAGGGANGLPTAKRMTTMVSY